MPFIVASNFPTMMEIFMGLAWLVLTCAAYITLFMATMIRASPAMDRRRLPKVLWTGCVFALMALASPFLYVGVFLFSLFVGVRSWELASLEEAAMVTAGQFAEVAPYAFIDIVAAGICWGWKSQLGKEKEVS